MEGRFSTKEAECELTFRKLGKVFNANTPENHPIVFNVEDDYKSAVSVLAICVKSYPGICLLAFQVMSNHIHLVISGDQDEIQVFFAYFVSRLDKLFNGTVDFSKFALSLFPVCDLTYLRNAIAYVNRNGFVVNNDVTPFSYPWGSSAYFFQPHVVRYAQLAGRAIGVNALRSLTHSRNLDAQGNLKMVDGYISPLEFCEIQLAEKLYRDAKQYFYLISRNVESYAELAKTIGESIFYSDNDLYLAAVKMAYDHYGTRDLKTLTVSDKLEMARRLHYDYNAGDKQLQRMLKIDSEILKALF